MVFLLFISCNNSGTSPKDGQAAKSDGTILDLATITKNIKDTVAFAKDVKEVYTLVKSIDELAKAIGKKVEAAGTLGDDGGKNGSLISGAYSVVLFADTKLGQLEKKEGISAEFKAKVAASKAASKAFTDKVKGENASLGKNDASDDDTKKAIKKDNGDKTKGAEELIKLNTAIDALLTAAEAAVTAAINALTTSTKPSNI
ncbi:Variable small protein 1 (plasmid) [Borrelia turicatae]|uniref:Variable small protein 1 n=1 Tax=Borrelia turicatae TaxID=142 RepID=A0A172XDJ0_BORTU|nr:Variable small protein 1 [Borrelia turicatae]